MCDTAVGLDDIVRWVGLTIAVGGAFSLNPVATARWSHDTRVWLRDRGTWIHKQLARVLPFLRRPASGTSLSVVGTAMSTAWGHVSHVTAPLPPGATIEARIDALEKRALALENEIDALSGQLQRVERENSAKLAETAAAIRAEIRQLEASFESFADQTVNMDSRAMPVILFGLILTGLAPDAARIPNRWWWVAGVLLVVIVVFVACTIWRIWRDWRKENPKADNSAKG